MHISDKSAPRQFKIHPTVFIAETATVIGDVTIARDSSVWFSAVLRGDGARITLGEGCNVQDGAIVHVDPGFPSTLGHRVTVGHGAIVHGAAIEDDVLIGMGAVLLNGARIGTLSIIAAGTVIPEGKEIPPRSLVMGLPGKVIRPVTEAEIERIKEGSRHYVERARNYWKGIYK